MSCRALYGTLSNTPVSPWIVTVGLEIHAQLATPHKLFSSAQNRFSSDPNRDLAPFDAALPGTQPRLNQHAVSLAVRAALAFDCKVNPASSFDRKHYFYPDQPAGYQITQHYNPLAHHGSFSLFERDGIGQKDSIEVGIAQVQIEQDTARTTYFESPPESLVDLNRNGAPLIEVVTTPSIPSAQAAGAALRKVQAILRAVQASDASMEAGGMRCDVNVSVTTSKDRHLGPSRRIEIKNLANGRIVTDAVTAESARQIAVLSSGGTVGKETRGYDVEKRETFLTRTKETATDYRYMPEPDLHAIKISNKFLEQCRSSLPELPDAQLDRLLAAPFSLALNDARVLLQNANLKQLYDDVLQRLGSSGRTPKVVANWIVHELLGRERVMTESGKAIHSIGAEQMSSLIRMVLDGTLNGSAAKMVLQIILEGHTRTVKEIVDVRGLTATSSEEELLQIVGAIMDKSPSQASKLKSGDTRIAKWFVGQVMRETKGYVLCSARIAILVPIVY